MHHYYTPDLDLLTTAEAARELNVKIGTVREALSKGKLHGLKHGTQWLINRKEITRYVAECNPHSAALDRFMGKVDASGDCWVWTGSVAPNGYGRFFLDGKVVYAHRAAYELTHGTIPDGLYVCHHCDNPRCVQPDHLFLGTPSDNALDKVQKGRANPYKNRKRAPFVSLTCGACGGTFERLASDVSKNQRWGNKRTFCSKECSKAFLRKGTIIRKGKSTIGDTGTS